jgi:hypothetical protein
MKKIHTLGFGILLSTLLVGSSVASAQAQEPQPQESQPEESQPKKMGENISQINGQIVKVGEHQQYKYDYKTWNVSTNPLGLIVGSYGGSVSYSLHANVALKFDATYTDFIGEDSSTSFEFDITAPIYFKHMHNGFYLEPGFMSRRTREKQYNFNSNENLLENDTVYGPQILMGWHHSWDSGFNVSYAFGAGRDLNKTETLFANGYLRVGYAF